MSDNEFQDVIICPYCSYKHEDSWEDSIDLEDGDQADKDCDSCGKAFIFSVHRDVTYSSMGLK